MILKVLKGKQYATNVAIAIAAYVITAELWILFFLADPVSVL